MNKAVFLDRDGTINVEKEYLYRCEDFEFIPGVPQAIARLNRAGYLVIVVSNQSGIARGMYREADVDKLHVYINRQLRAFNARIDQFYYCPHHPDVGVEPYRRQCTCRKGQPGMLLRAAEEFLVDLDASYMIGDKVADIDAAVAAGCTPMLVLTGYGVKTRGRIDADIAVYPDLPAAVEAIL